MNVALIGAGIISTGLTVYYIKSSQIFAEKNPAQALLEGAPLVDLRRAEMAAKGGALVSSSPKELTPAAILPDIEQ